MAQDSISFTAPEYQADGSFRPVPYVFARRSGGWDILRDGVLHEQVGTGYVAVRSEICGICSTDLARRFLPYPLPQIIGHEVLGRHEGRRVVVEINASHAARGLATECGFCNGGMPSQCPERITLGINRLPGGFAPWFLAPEKALLPVPETLPSAVAALTEPFAATLQALQVNPPRAGQEVAVLGPRRLGMLLIGALAARRRRSGGDFRIHALVRHGELEDLCRRLGADSVSRTDQAGLPANRFDLVFDTTGNPDGLEEAIRLSRGPVHLKSTHGRGAMGMDQLTALVVDELALLPWQPDAPLLTQDDAGWFRAPASILVDRALGDGFLRELQARHPRCFFHAGDPADAGVIRALPRDSPLPRYDGAIVQGAAAADRCIRPDPAEEFSPVRPRGAILMVPSPASDHPMEKWLSRPGSGLYSSRCGPFAQALALLAGDEELCRVLADEFITSVQPAGEIGPAFALAADSSKSLKILINTEHQGL